MRIAVSASGASANLRFAQSNGISFCYCLMSTQQKEQVKNLFLLLVGGGGFEPPKSETSDLQSDAFGHSAIRPY